MRISSKTYREPHLCSPIKYYPFPESHPNYVASIPFRLILLRKNAPNRRNFLQPIPIPVSASQRHFESATIRNHFQIPDVSSIQVIFFDFPLLNTTRPSLAFPLSSSCSEEDLQTPLPELPKNLYRIPSLDDLL